MNWHRDNDGGRRGYHHGNLREALIKAALDLISEKGPAGFTFAEAARAAGVSAAAPYRHYRDRDALIADVAKRGYELFEAALAKAWNGGKPDVQTAFDALGPRVPRLRQARAGLLCGDVRKRPRPHGVSRIERSGRLRLQHPARCLRRLDRDAARKASARPS